MGPGACPAGDVDLLTAKRHADGVGPFSDLQPTLVRCTSGSPALLLPGGISQLPAASHQPPKPVPGIAPRTHEPLPAEPSASCFQCRHRITRGALVDGHRLLSWQDLECSGRISTKQRNQGALSPLLTQ